MKERIYTDIHSHIIPGIDDGAATMDEALQMIGLAYEEGIRCMYATSHYDVAVYHYERTELEEAFQGLVSKCTEIYPDMQLILGNELFYRDGILEELRSGKACTMGNSRYVLVEFPFGSEARYIYQGLRRLREYGYRPILAHVERYRNLVGNLKEIEYLHSMGVYIQVNTKSFLGGMLNSNTRWCMKLLKEGYVQFFGSDTHDCKERSPVMRQAVVRLQKKTDSSQLEQILYENPQLLVK